MISQCDETLKKTFEAETPLLGQHRLLRRSHLGLACAALGETKRAIELDEQAFKIFREIGDKQSEGAVLGNLGRAYVDLGDPYRAIDFFDQHLRITHELDDLRGEANSLYGMSLALYQLRQYDSAIAYGRTALRIFEQIGDPFEAKVREQLAKWSNSK
jgi:tetratricopeptide (TPR) repeat protein